MEAAGLVIGAFALVDVFSSCIELFSYISASRSLGRDADRLVTKLDVEKTQLMYWATRVRLSKCDYDPRLNDPHTKELLGRVLHSIQGLLSDGTQLQRKYGMRSIEKPEEQLSLALSESRCIELENDLERLDAHPGYHHDRQKKVSRLRRLRWAIQDKEKFEKLICELSYFTEKLEKIVPVETDQVQLFKTVIRDLLTQDLKNIKKAEQVLLIEQVSKGKAEAIAEVAQDRLRAEAEAKILDLFWFRTMDDRRDDVALAHPETFDWALDPPKHAGWSDLSQFLGSGSGIYWVHGMPGSGKSTLMKHVYYHPKTSNLLRKWAGSIPCTRASFFFWCLGTVEQRSHTGLIKALLFHLLTPVRALIPELLPRTWKELYGSDETASLPSQAEIKQAMSSLGRWSNLPHKWCLFIDGLDEYEGDYAAVIDLFKGLAANPHMKIVVSSRPLNVCVRQFSDLPNLRLQDLTRDDIIKYVHDTIGSDQCMEQLREVKPEAAEAICEDLVAKAYGVFLWVEVACRSVKDGFNNADSVSELQARIDELPQELEDLFSHILGKIEMRYRSQGARLLRLQYHSQLVERTQPLSALGIALQLIAT